jgi:uncharacterized membrane protein
MWGLLAVALTLSTVELIWAHRRGGLARRDAWLVSSLRVLGLLALGAMATELAIRVVAPSTDGRRVAVLIDRSASMALPDGDDRRTRAERAAESWAKATTQRAAWAEAGLRVEAHAFDDELHALSTDAAGAGSISEALEDPRGAASDLTAALGEIAKQKATQRAGLAGVVVVSDGLVSPDAATERRLFAMGERLGVPITTVATGREAIRDVAIGDLAVGEFAFVENVTLFEVELVGRGLEQDERVTLELFRDGERVASEPIRVGNGARSVQFELIPDRVGQFVYEFRVSPIEGEATTRNNRRLFVVKVLRDKVRALHVAGRPDWDVRALRTLLRRDPNVELLSYYILRDEEDSLRSDDSAPMSLIGFPVDELFDRQLETFDLVILHNFDARTHGDYSDNLARYVIQGGSLMVIGGDLGLASGDYVGSPLGDVLPVDTRRKAGFVTEPLRPSLTAAGRRHPITRFLADRTDAGENGWSGLPALDNYNPIQLSRDSRLEPTALLAGPEGPLLVTGEPGAGRVLTLMTGASWRLGFAPNLPLIDGARPYDLLWLGVVRWLLRDEAADRLVLETDRAQYSPGTPVEIGARSLSPSYLPQPDVNVRWEVRRLDVDEAEPTASGRWTTDALGRAREQLDGLPRGAYELIGRRDDPQAEAEADSDEDLRPVERARRVFVIDEGHRELAEVDATAGTARLARLARATGGDALVAGDDAMPVDLPLADPDERDPSAHAALRSRDVPVGSGWPMTLVVLLAFAGEWWVRRRGGLA